MADTTGDRVRGVVGIAHWPQVVEGFEFQVIEFHRQRGVIEYLTQNSSTFSSVFQEANFENPEEEELEERDNRSRETNEEVKVCYSFSFSVSVSPGPVFFTTRSKFCMRLPLIILGKTLFGL